uniref:Ig-like domain-containing protein n=1 Tax=Acanthochromis polyacanthus TaxID=80966 RepID=A0A3Q1GL84_9TELE
FPRKSQLVIFAIWFLCILSSLAITLVLYPQQILTPARGSSVKLSCETNYDYKKCGLLHVVWHNTSSQNDDKITELTDPKKYLTAVNETVNEGNRRRRQVVTEILNLRPKDNGRYQCQAKCNNGEEARGHFITITVRGGTVMIKQFLKLSISLSLLGILKLWEKATSIVNFIW